jgi:hypothetical protein
VATLIVSKEIEKALSEAKALGVRVREWREPNRYGLKACIRFTSPNGFMWAKKRTKLEFLTQSADVTDEQYAERIYGLLATMIECDGCPDRMTISTCYKCEAVKGLR